MGGRHRQGRHRKRPPIARRVLLFLLTTSSLVVLAIAFNRPTQVVDDSTPQPAPPVLDLSIPTTEPEDSQTTKPPSKKKRNPAAQAPQTAAPKIHTSHPVTPRVPRTIKPVRPPAVAARPPDVPPVTPRTGKPSPVVNPQRIVLPKSKPSIITIKPTTIPKPIPVPRPKVVPSPPIQVPTTTQPITTTKTPPKTTSKPALKPTTPTTTSVLPNNPKCANIGLLVAPMAACNRILAAFPQIKSVLGVGSRPDNPTSCHPKGLAIDFMVGTDKALGDRLFAFITANRIALGASPVILWQVPDHLDHVHVSFEPCKG
jgi:hypothetical protein